MTVVGQLLTKADSDVHAPAYSPILHELPGCRGPACRTRNHRVVRNGIVRLRAQVAGYIQAWWGQGHAIPERSAQRILKAADQILKAGTVDQAGASS